MNILYILYIFVSYKILLFTLCWDIKRYELNSFILFLQNSHWMFKAHKTTNLNIRNEEMFFMFSLNWNIKLQWGLTVKIEATFFNRSFKILQSGYFWPKCGAVLWQIIFWELHELWPMPSWITRKSWYTDGHLLILSHLN